MPRTDVRAGYKGYVIPIDPPRPYKLTIMDKLSWGSLLVTLALYFVWMVVELHRALPCGWTPCG